MDSRDVFNKTIKYGNEIKKKRLEMESLAKKITDLWAECNHEIVFKYRDDHPRKMMIDGHYFCPACGQTIKCIYEDDLKESSYKNSLIVPLTNLSLVGDQETYSAIREEVYYNYDFYYNLDTTSEEMQAQMEGVLKDYEEKYTSVDKVLKKIKSTKTGE